MKTKAKNGTRVILTMLLLALPTLLVAQQRGGGGGNGSGMRGGMGMGNGNGGGPGNRPAGITQASGDLKRDNLTPLKQFVNLSDKQLIAIRNVIDQILEMSPEEREALKKKIAEYEQLDPAAQETIRQGWGHVSSDYRNDWRSMMQSLNDEKRAEIQEKLQSLSYDERNDYRIRLIDEWRAEKEN